MNRLKLTGILFIVCSCCLMAVQNVKAAACPSTESYAMIYYNHQLLNSYVASGTYSQAFGLHGPVGIEISPSGIVTAGNNSLTRTIDLVYTTPNCDCLSDTAESIVTVTINGYCSNGVLYMEIHEVYPNSSALVTCTGDDDCPIYTQPFPGTTNDFNMEIDYINGTTITQPYMCDNCSGTYSWRLQFTEEPPDPDDIDIVPLAPLLHLLLRQNSPLP